jgi:hypothetical protein
MKPAVVLAAAEATKVDLLLPGRPHCFMSLRPCPAVTVPSGSRRDGRGIPQGQAQQAMSCSRKCATTASGDRAVRVDGHDRCPTARSRSTISPLVFDDHQQAAGLTVTAQAAQVHLPAGLGMGDAHRSSTTPTTSSAVTSWAWLAQSQPT